MILTFQQVELLSVVFIRFYAASTFHKRLQLSVIVENHCGLVPRNQAAMAAIHYSTHFFSQ